MSYVDGQIVLVKKSEEYHRSVGPARLSKASNGVVCLCVPWGRVGHKKVR
jgi:hypothetical protein